MTIRTLVVAPHADDELLGVGGTLMRRKAEGGKIAWLLVSSVSEQHGWSAERVRTRNDEIERVASRLGFDQVFRLDFPPTRLDGIPRDEMIRAVSERFNAFQPEEVFVPHGNDIHSDHRIVFDVVASCTKWFRYPSVSRVLAYETISETDFVLRKEQAFFPNVYVNIEPYLKAKLELLAIYSSEIGDFPFPRSIQAVEALARLRGAASGYLAAEAFELLRERS